MPIVGLVDASPRKLAESTYKPTPFRAGYLTRDGLTRLGIEETSERARALGASPVLRSSSNRAQQGWPALILDFFRCAIDQAWYDQEASVVTPNLSAMAFGLLDIASKRHYAARDGAGYLNCLVLGDLPKSILGNRSHPAGFRVEC
jgi:hypothetical protein